MKKSLMCLFCAVLTLASGIVCYADFPTWESPRYIPEDEARTPWTEDGNPYVTYYAPWLRNFHIMTNGEAAENKENGIVGGEACQQIHQLAISPVNSDIMYLCTNTTGVYKTTNGGKHWYSVTNNAAGHDAKGLLCDNKDENIVYVNMRKTGVHRSKDGGYTWQQIIADTDSVQSIGRRSDTIVQDSVGNTYMAVGSGIYKLERETDTLTNLTAAQFPDLAALTGSDGAEFLDIDVSADGNYIYACCAMASSGTNVATGIYASTDGGVTWEVRNTSPDNAFTYTNIRTVEIDPENSNKIYVGMKIVDNSTQTTGAYCLYVSGDGGKTYTKLYTPQNLSGENIYFYGLKFGPKNASGKYPLYLHLDRTIYPLRVSYDYTRENPTFKHVYTKEHQMGAGTIRENYTGLLYQAFQPDMTTAGTDNVRVIYSASGVYEYIATYDAETASCTDSSVSRISAGFSGASMTDIAFDSKGKMFAPVVDVGSYVDDAESVYSESTYPTFTAGAGARYGVRAIFDPDDDNHVIIYVGSSNGYGTYSGIKQSSDGGYTFADINADAKLLTVEPVSEDGEGETEEDWGNSGGENTETDTDSSVSDWATYGNAEVLCYDKDNSDIIYSSYHNSYDNGKTWVKNDYFLLDVHPENTKLQVGITGTGTGTVLYKTTDGGESWSKVMNLSYSDFIDVDFDLKDSNYIWFTRNKMFGRINLTTGQIENYTSKFGYRAFSNVEINPDNPDHMIITSSPGTIVSSMWNDFKVAESYDNGNTWHTVPGFWGTAFNNIVFSPTTDEVFILGHRGTMIYDYNKFNYYQTAQLGYNGESVLTTLPRINSEGKNVNNGKYVIAPEDVFKPESKIFAGWKYNGSLYRSGEKIEIAQ